MNKLIYLKLELKRKFKLIPQILIGTIALSLVVGAIVFCASKLLYSDVSIKEKRTIVFTSQDDSEMTGLIVSALRSSKSITSVCNIIESDYDTAIKMVQNEDAIAAVIIPKDFMNSLMNGENYPISIRYSSTKSIYTMVITELTKAAQYTLQTAQAGVYTLHDYYKANDVLEYENKANKSLNMIYLGKAFNRGKFFDRHIITATGNLSTTNYYFASGIMLILLLLGCVFILKSKDTDEVISLKLHQNGIGAFSQTLAHLISNFTVLYVLASTFMIILYALNSKIDIGFQLSLKNILINNLFICLCCSAFMCFTGNLMSGKYSAILLHFIFVIICSFISGAFIPDILLPEPISKIADYMPTTYILNIIGTMFTGEVFTEHIIKLLIFTGIFTLLTTIFIKIHLLEIKHFGKRGND